MARIYAIAQDFLETFAQFERVESGGRMRFLRSFVKVL